MKYNIITTILFTFPIFAVAQPVEYPAENNKLEAITVYSAYATPVNQDKTASSVTVVTEKEFTARNATYVSDVLKSLPGVALSSSGGRGTLTNLYLRGADANHTAVVIDGVKINPVTGYGFDFGGLSLSNIDRIEVLRGEQSALWGSDAMGGVIYITTKNGLYKDKLFNIDFDFGTGSHGTYDASTTLSGYKNGFYYAINGNTHRTKGISALSSHQFSYKTENGSTINTGGAVEKDKFHRDVASLRIGYDNSDKGIELLVSHSSQSVRFDETYLRSETLYDDYTRTRDTLFKLSGYLGNDKEWFTHKINVSHIKTNSNTFSTTHLYDKNYNIINTVPSISRYDAKKLNANYQLDINFDRDGAITQGISLLSEYQHSSYNANNYPNTKHLSEKSLAIEYRLFSENDHSLSLSGRYTDNSQYKNAFTGRISGAYRITPNIKVHTGIGSAVQNPTMTEYYGWNGTFIANPDLKPEKSRGGDIGLLIESTNKHHRLDITYFGRYVKDLIGSERQNGVYRAINIIGSSKIRGVEVGYSATLRQNLTYYANYTYTQAKNGNGVELARRPKHTANTGVAYQITERFGSNLNLAYVGKRIDTYPSRTKLPSYTLVNFGMNYQIAPNLNVYANLNNLFDKKYENILGYGQDGRNFYIGLKGSF
ncbi:TonB-dependent receptor plug domain-containing protein [Rodentibacter caecimuris]|uniref:Cobalamin receptor n=1 Tax=Rodentibacter caecimuris TaxID=1796644 RepID=A0ABX3KY40_9PAST|nr:cobalamin receptor [Rodentibacter heylii]